MILFLIFLIFIVIFSIFIHKKIKYYKSQLPDIIKIKFPYKLGDFITRHEMRIMLISSYKHYFKNSIAVEYYENTNRINNFLVLKEIVKKRGEKIKLPGDDVLVVHLRTGDVIDLSKNSVEDFLTNYVIFKQTGINYVKPLIYYKESLNFFPKLKKVIIVTGSHKNLNDTKSKKYIEEIGSFFQKEGMIVKYRAGGDADEDFVFMCHSKYFIKSGGNFSNIISNIVKLENGLVYL